MPCSRRNCARTYYCYLIFRSSQALRTALKFSELLVPLHSSPWSNQYPCPKVSASDTKICRFFKNLQISADSRNPRYALLLCSRMLPLFKNFWQPNPRHALEVFGTVHAATQLCTPDSENVFENDSFWAKNLQIFLKSADFKISSMKSADSADLNADLKS